MGRAKNTISTFLIYEKSFTVMQATHNTVLPSHISSMALFRGGGGDRFLKACNFMCKSLLL